MINEFDGTIALLDNSLIYYIICTDTDGNYSYINRNYARTFHYIDDNFVGKPYYITMHPDDRKTCEETSYKCMQHPDSTFPATIRKHNGSGGYIITQWEYKAMFNDEGVFTGMFCLGFDITELDKKKDTLKQIAFEQSHLVRAPLSNILGLINILHKMEMDESLKTMIDMLQESSRKLDAVIRQIVNKTYS